MIELVGKDIKTIIITISYVQEVKGKWNVLNTGIVDIIKFLNELQDKKIAISKWKIILVWFNGWLNIAKFHGLKIVTIDILQTEIETKILKRRAN